MHVSEIALEVGFESLASFSKAFNQVYFISPKQARKNKALLFHQNKITPEIADFDLVPDILYLSLETVYYQSTKCHYVNEDIEWLWDKMALHNFTEKKTEYYGVIADQPLITDKIKCRYDACASFKPAIGLLPSKKILGGRYAKFLHTGGYKTIEETYCKIYANWVLNTKLEFSPSPIIEHYIKHKENVSKEEDFITAILIPIY